MVHFNILSYQECKSLLEDYLEIKLEGIDVEKKELIKRLLGREKRTAHSITVIDGVICNDTLFVIQTGHSQKIQDVLVLQKKKALSCAMHAPENACIDVIETQEECAV